MARPCPPFVTVGEAAQGALVGLMLAALTKARPVLADMRHPADPELEDALAAVDAALVAGDAR